MILTNLPNELLLYILEIAAENFGSSGIASLSRVCWQFYHLANSEIIWIVLYQKLFGRNISSCDDPRSQFRNMYTLSKVFGAKLYNTNDLGMNALHISTKDRWNSGNMIRTLITHGMNPRDRTYGGKTALHTAVEFQNEDSVCILTDHDDSLHKLKDLQGRTCLHIAAATGNYNIVLKLIQIGADPVSVDSRRQTPLHYAAKSGHVNVCRLLAPLYGRRFIELADINGHTALSLAAVMNQRECMKVLIEEFYARLDVSDHQGRSVMDSIMRLMDESTIKWATHHQIWKPQSSYIHPSSTESECWDMVAMQDQQRYFEQATQAHYH